MVPRYFTLHASVEPQIENQLASLPPGPHAALQVHTRLRTAAIAAALCELGVPAPALPPAKFALASPAEALGALYVLEGSSLGGRMILRDLRARGADTTGLHFLDPYGETTGAHWRALLAVLESELASEPARQAACDGALATFALARICLRDGVATFSHAA